MRGDGKGPAATYLRTPPRDFTRGVYKFRTTSQDGMPSDLDLYRSITAGFPAYGMPSFRYLSGRDRWALVHTMKTFYPKWQEFGEPEHVKLGAEPPAGPVAIERGRHLYEVVFNCAQCHGPKGRGDGQRAGALKDLWGRAISPRDFTRGPTFLKAGWRRGDTVRILATGLPGTPMPSHLDQVADPNDARDFWDIARYVEHLTLQVQSGRRERFHE